MKKACLLLFVAVASLGCDSRSSNSGGSDQVVQCVDSEKNVVATSTVSSEWKHSYESGLYMGSDKERFFPPMAVTCSVRAAR